MTWLWGGLAVLVLWAGIVALRREEPERPRNREAKRPRADDGIDRDELERAEREVRDLDAFDQPDDGFQGDDWGPGAPRGFPPV